jgi:hypothetical protein
VHEDGTVPGVKIRIPGFHYDVVSQQTVDVPEGYQGEYHCTGNSFYGAGEGTASGGSGSSGPPPLIPGDFFSKPVKFNAGDPWGRGSMIGKCPGKVDSKKWVEGIKADINSLPSSPFTFQVTWHGVQSASGTCRTYSWETAYRSITCNWAAYSGGYKRKTAPGAG